MEVDGKPYGLNPMKMLRKTSVTDKPSYFCSELVASAYKRLQLLPESVSTGEYLPTTFAQATNLQLLRGKLEDEILVEFRKNEVAESRTASTSSGLTAEQHRQLAKWMHPMDRGSMPAVLSIAEEKRSRSPSPAPEPLHVPRRRASSIPSPTRRMDSADTLLAVLKSMDDLDGVGHPALNSATSATSSASSRPSHSSVEEEWSQGGKAGEKELSKETPAVEERTTEEGVAVEGTTIEGEEPFIEPSAEPQAIEAL